MARSSLKSAVPGQPLTIADWTGGRNTYRSIDEIGANETAAQNDTWAEKLSLSQRRGYTSAAIVPREPSGNLCTLADTASFLTPIPSMLMPTQLGPSNTGRLMLLGANTSGSTQNSILMRTDDGTTFYVAGYGTGTITVAGSAVTGSGTVWNANIQAGDVLAFNGANGATLAKISSVNSDTSITLVSSIGGNANAGTTYAISPIMQNQVGWCLFDVSGNQNIFFSDTSRNYRYDGTTMVRMDNAASPMPTGNVLIAHQNYIFVIGQDSKTVKWCNLLDGTTWASANSQTVTYAGDPIQTGFVYQGSLFIFNTRTIRPLYGTVFDPVNPQYFLGKVNVPSSYIFSSRRSVCIKQGVLCFRANDGWYRYIGGPEIQKISLPIQVDVDAFPAVTPTSNGDVPTLASAAITWKDRMWCSVADASSKYSIYVLDDMNKWWKWSPKLAANVPGFSDFAIIGFSTNAVGLYGVAGAGTTAVSNNKLYTMDTGNTDDGTAIAGSHDTKEFTFPTDVTFVYARVFFKSQSAGNLTFGYSIDRRTYITFSLSQTTGAGTVIANMVPIGSVGKAIRFQFKNSTNNQTFEVYKVELYTEPSEAIRA